MKKSILGTIVAILMLTLLCACGSSAEEPATTEAQTPSTVTAGEAAQKASESASQDGADTDATDADFLDTTPGTEDGAMDAALSAAYNDIKGFDGKWQNLSLDVDEPITTIAFDWNGEHYTYQYDEDARMVVK